MLSNTAGEIEEEKKMDTRIKNLDELANNINYRFMGLTKWTMMACGIGIMIASTVTNIFIVASHFEQVYGMSPFMIRFLIFVAMCIILIIVIEPEKIQFLTYFTTSIIIIIGSSSFI